MSLFARELLKVEQVDTTDIEHAVRQQTKRRPRCCRKYEDQRFDLQLVGIATIIYNIIAFPL